MLLVDTHCHLHDPAFEGRRLNVIADAIDAEVGLMITIGTDEANSRHAVRLATEQPMVVKATVGVHPHSAAEDSKFLRKLAKQPEVVAIGEIGLDYFYEFADRQTQRQALEKQIKLALKLRLPIVFHVREAWEDFWQVVDQFQIPRAVVHCFTGDQANLERVLAKNWFVGLNGIATFAKPDQLQVFAQVPIEQLLLETDAPYLSPAGKRGQTNQPANLRVIAEFLADLYQVELEELARVTTANAKQLFGLDN